MIAVIIGTHGMFSEEILKSAEMIFGEQENVGSVTFKPGEGVENLIEKYNELINDLDCTDGILFMVDLFGGSPFNAASMIAMKNATDSASDLVTDLNLAYNRTRQEGITKELPEITSALAALD